HRTGRRRSMNDSPLTPPPDREVSAQLRARVLNTALASTTEAPARPTSGRSRFIAPIAVGLAAASVMTAVAIGVTHRDDNSSPYAGPGTSDLPTVLPTVEAHTSIAVDKGQIGEKRRETLRTRCLEFDSFKGASHTLSSRRLLVNGTYIPALSW